MALWPHQEKAVSEVADAILAGKRRILLASPTGMGKTAMASELIRIYLDEDRKVVLYTNRKLLIDQASRVMALAGHEHGVRAAGYQDDRSLNFQIASVQTEASRSLKTSRWQLHDAELAILDECHLGTAGTYQKILESHYAAGAVYIGLTATPVGLGALYDHLIVAGTTSEGRKCGALVPALVYGPDEPDLKEAGYVVPGEDLTEKQASKVMMREGVFGRVLKWWRELNPGQTPTLLFAPGVKESVWFAQQFAQAGIRAAHLDGAEIWLDGEFKRSDGRDAREDLFREFREGKIKVLCNRFVLREGIDLPFVECLILATVFGSVQTYLQVIGRGLRASPQTEKTHLILQDHGGNYWRHGSPNADREWSLEWSASQIAGMREDRLREKKCRRCKAVLPGGPVCVKCGFINEVVGQPCPQCKRIITGRKCPCGYEAPQGAKSRSVVQSDGTLKEIGGDVFRPRRLYTAPNGPAVWQKMYWRSRTEKGKRTFRQAAALFAAENHWGWPSKTWPMMPLEEGDWYRFVGDVPMDRLVPKLGK